MILAACKDPRRLSFVEWLPHTHRSRQEFRRTLLHSRRQRSDFNSPHAYISPIRIFLLFVPHVRYILIRARSHFTDMYALYFFVAPLINPIYLARVTLFVRGGSLLSPGFFFPPPSVFESNASNILTCRFVQGKRGWAKFKPNFPSTASCRFLFRQPFCSFSSVAFFLSLSHQVITIPIQSQSYVRE
jgi:hypothetical protein